MVAEPDASVLCAGLGSGVAINFAKAQVSIASTCPPGAAADAREAAER